MPPRAHADRLRHTASKFHSGSTELHRQSSRLRALAQQANWHGPAATAYQNSTTIIVDDLSSAGHAMEQVSLQLNKLATAMERAEQYKLQADQLEYQLWNIHGDEDHTREERRRIRDRIHHLREQATQIAEQADREATSAFDAIQDLVHRLHFYAEISKASDSTLLDSLWNGITVTGEAVAGFVYGVGESVVDAVVGTVDAIIHLDETIAGLWYTITNFGEVVDSIWTSISESWENEVVNGDVFSAAKWFGNAVGIVATSLIGGGSVIKGVKVAKTAAKTMPDTAVTTTAKTTATTTVKTGQSATQLVKTQNILQKHPNTCLKDPIDTSTGAQVIDAPFLTLRGAVEVPFSLHYNSLLDGTGALGRAWSHNHETRLTFGEKTLTVHWNALRENVFALQADGSYRSADLHARRVVVHREESGYVLHQPDQSQLVFTEHGQLQRSVSRHGHAVGYFYTEEGRLARITEAVSGRFFELSYEEQRGLLSCVSDSSGRQIQFQYDESNRLQVLIDANGNLSTLNYDEKQRLTRVTNPDGSHVFLNEFDEEGRVVRQQDGNGHWYSLAYDETTRPGYLITTGTNEQGHKRVLVHDHRYQLVELIDECGAVTKFAYDEQGNCVHETRPNGGVWRYEYDERGNRTRQIDASGHVSQFSYDERSNLVEAKHALGESTTYRYEERNLLVEVKDAAGHVTNFHYNELGLLASRTNPLGETVQYRYDEGGNVVAFVDAEGHETKIRPDEMGRIAALIDPLGHETTRTYDANDNVLAVTDPLGRTTRFEYDAEDRVVAYTDALNRTTTYAYDGNGQLIAQVDALGQKKQYEYDSEGRLLLARNEAGHAVRYEYDPVGRLVRTIDAMGNSHQYQYDAEGHLLSVVDALGNKVEQATYDQVGNPRAVTDALGRTTTYRFNALGQLIERTSAGGHQVAFTYDALSQLTTVLEGNEFASHQTFDPAGRLASYTDPNGNTTERTYTRNGQLLREKNAAGGATTYSYDSRGQLETRMNAREQESRYSYDAAGQLVEYVDEEGTIQREYDEVGNLVSVTEEVHGGGVGFEADLGSDSDADSHVGSRAVANAGACTISRIFDDLNRVTQYTNERGHTIGYEYDAAGHVSALIYPDGKRVHYEYDAAGRLTRVTDWNGRTTQYTYDRNGRLIKIERANRTEELRTYDAAGQLTQIRDLNSLGLVIQQFRFQYDADGRVTQENNWYYTYDTVGRLLEGRDRQYAYDKGGNLTAVRADDAGGVQTSFSYDPDNRLASVDGQELAMDADGNLLTASLRGSSYRLQYDARNRLLAVGNVRYTYNAENHRTVRTDGEHTTHFVINPHTELSQVLMELDDAGNVQAWNVYGLGLLGRYEADGTYRTYHYDLRGSTTFLTNERGKATDRYTYGAYGELLSHEGPTSQPFQYNGRDGVVTDPNGLYYMRHRYYHPELKRFLNRDIVRGEIVEGQTFNRFAYVNGDPISYVDPLGLSKWCSTGSSNNKIPDPGYHLESFAPKPVKPQNATNHWEQFLGPGEYTNIHPRTGLPDPNRIVSADGKRSIRYGDHEMNSSPSKHHYHEETWTYDPINHVMNVDNIVVRVPNPKR